MQTKIAQLNVTQWWINNMHRGGERRTYLISPVTDLLYQRHTYDRPPDGRVAHIRSGAPPAILPSPSPSPSRKDKSPGSPWVY